MDTLLTERGEDVVLGEGQDHAVDPVLLNRLKELGRMGGGVR